MTQATTTYTATYGGKTVTRKGTKLYTHASVVRWSNGDTEVVSFHTSEAAALKGVLTAQQKGNGAHVVAAVPVTRGADSAIQRETAVKPKSKLPYTVDSKLREQHIHEQILAQVGPPPERPAPRGLLTEEQAAAWVPASQAWSRRYEEAYRAHPETTGYPGSSGPATGGMGGVKAVERGLMTPYVFDGPRPQLTPEGRAHVETTSPTPPPVKAAPATGNVSGTLDRPRTGTYTGDIPANPKERREHKPLTDHVKALTLAVNTGPEANALGYAMNDEPMQPGDEVMVDTFGKLRRGVVTRVGGKNVRVAYATPSGGYMQETEAPAAGIFRKTGEPRGVASGRRPGGLGKA